jgi:hypothetical protein
MDFDAAVDALAIDVGAVATALIFYEVDVFFTVEPGMVTRDTGVFEDDVLFGFTSDGDGKALERDGTLLEAVAEVEHEAGSDLGGRFS